MRMTQLFRILHPKSLPLSSKTSSIFAFPIRRKYRDPLPLTQSSLPLSAGIQFSRYSIRAFHDRIQNARKQRAVSSLSSNCLKFSLSLSGKTSQNKSRKSITIRMFDANNISARSYIYNSIYQYSSMAPRLSGQNYKFFKFPLSFNFQKRPRYKENNTKYRGLTWKPRSHVRILIYRTWPIHLGVCHVRLHCLQPGSNITLPQESHWKRPEMSQAIICEYSKDYCLNLTEILDSQCLTLLFVQNGSTPAPWQFHIAGLNFIHLTYSAWLFHF